MNIEAIRSELRRLREAKKLSHAKLVAKTADPANNLEALGLTSITDIEYRRTKNPGVITLARLVSALGQTLSQFFANVEALEGNPFAVEAQSGNVEPPSGEGREAHSPDLGNLDVKGGTNDVRGVTPISSAREIRRLRRELEDVRLLAQSLKRILTATLTAQAQSAGDRSATSGDPGTSGGVPARGTGTHPHPSERRKGDRRNDSGHESHPRLGKK